MPKKSQINEYSNQSVCDEIPSYKSQTKLYTDHQALEKRDVATFFISHVMKITV